VEGDIMRTAFAKRMGRVRASDIRELLKLTVNRDVISLAGGLPAPELFPVSELADLTSKILDEHGAAALQYSPSEGHEPLRAQIAARMNARWKTSYASDQILVTTGSQQGLDLIGKLFLDEGDEILCESPTYVGAISAWNVFQPRWVEVPTDDDGMNASELERLLDARRQVKFIYVVPNFQNPSGRTWSLERRRLLMEAATRRGVHVIEDNPYGEVRFEGADLPSLRTMDPEGLVITLGTFSKIFCPGLRIGWVAADAPVLAKLVLLKQGADLHTPTLNQMQVSASINGGGFEERIARIADVYRERRDAMMSALEREMPAGVRFTRPAGGLFLWVNLPPEVNARALLARCMDAGVAFVPGEGFFPNGGHVNTLRLNFSNMPPARIEEGIRRMAAALRLLTSESATPARSAENTLAAVSAREGSRS
jgi:DNA-binding transcriptional MocR family regulator